MIYVSENRKGAFANGRRELDVKDIPKDMLALLNN